MCFFLETMFKIKHYSNYFNNFKEKNNLLDKSVYIKNYNGGMVITFLIVSMFEFLTISKKLFLIILEILTFYIF